MLGAPLKRTLITMSGAKYDATTEIIMRRGLELGADRVLVYDDAWVSEHEFRKVNAWVFDHPGDRNGKRGHGWYSWKPLLIIDALDHCEHGDVVMYLDADTVPIANLSVIFDIAARDGAMFFKAQTHSNHRWNKRDCLIAMGQDNPETQFAPAGVARFMAFRKGGWRQRQLLWEWLAYAVNPTDTTFDPSVYGKEHEEFAEHRTEQAILTNLCHKHGFKLHRECDESGEESQEDRDLYPQLFRQIRQGACPNGQGSRFRNV